MSLRSLDWAVVNWSKKHSVICSSVVPGKMTNVHHSYRATLAFWKRKLFDPFRRRNRIGINLREDGGEGEKKEKGEEGKKEKGEEGKKEKGEEEKKYQGNKRKRSASDEQDDASVSSDSVPLNENNWVSSNSNTNPSSPASSAPPYETTLGQANFALWTYKTGVLAYVLSHLAEIEDDMNRVSKRQKRERAEAASRGEPRKRVELTRAPDTCCVAYFAPCVVEF